MTEKYIESIKLMTIGLGGYLVSVVFGENYVTENHAQINQWIQTFVLVLTSVGVIFQLLWNYKKHKNAKQNKDN